jgi:23S rRNA A2030 N6-methylase RlmJ
MVIVNPPWKLAIEIRTFAPALMDVLGRDSGRGYVLGEVTLGATGAGV